jgi:DMSO/TMAO reductase YedYZ molybdopterin-dependent catalytic subunit
VSIVDRRGATVDPEPPGAADASLWPGPPVSWTRGRRFGLGALVGLLAAGLAIGIGQAATVFVRPAASPIIVVGNRIILLTPESIRRWAIHQFGTDDKPTLLSGIYVGIAVFSVVVGILALYRLWLGLIGIAGFGAFGVYCALTTHAHQTGDIAPTLVGTLAALAALIVLVQSLTGARERRSRQTGQLISSRRQFIQAGLVTGAVASASGLLGWLGVRKRYDVSAVRSKLTLPAPASPAAALAPGTDLGKSAVPWVTPSSSFYRIDTALTVPQIDPAHWSLNIHGMVDHPIRLSYADLLARPLIERWITLACVSNVVGGGLIGNTRFLGAPLADILREAGVHSGADQLVSTSSDGMSIGTPTAVALDGRDAMLAVGMNGQPLPVEHGFPVRMVIPGLYGYVSACKWIVDIEATTFDRYSAYWVQAGWVQKAPIIIGSRTDTPRPSAQLTRGQPVAIAGVAWEQHIGVSKVEVQIDSGEWQMARLAPVPSTDTWQQWVLTWTPTSNGLHTIRVRATDRDGQLQSSVSADPFPYASSGWHTISLNVRG